MNGIDYLVDTNCFIYFLDENPLLLPFADDAWAFSYITEIELLSKKDILTAEELLIRNMLNLCFKVNHSQQISDTAIALRRKYKIKLPDDCIIINV